MTKFSSAHSSILLTLVSALSLPAHDITLFPQQQNRNIAVCAKYGHPGDYLPAAVNKMIELMVYAPGQKPTSSAKDWKTEGQEITIAPVDVPAGQDGVWVFAARYDNGFYVKTADGRSVATTKMDMPSAVTSSRNIKFGKALMLVGKPSKDYSRVVGHRLELVPQSNPFETKAGSKLSVLVRFDGKPLAGAGVEIGDGKMVRKEEDIPRYKTNAQGIAEVPFSKAGLQVLGVDHKTASAYPRLAQDDAYTATLTFELR